MIYRVGMDIGGTTTAVECFDIKHRQILKQQKNGISGVASSPQTAADVIAGFTDEITTYFDGIAPEAVACGIAGVGRNHTKNKIQTLLTQQYPDIRWFITDDIKAAYTGAFGRANGILLMAGTGSAIAGQYQGNWFRAGGFGHLIGDEGSGREIGRKGLRIAAHQMDAGKEGTMLSILDNQFQVSSRNELIEKVYGDNLPVAQFAEYMLRAADANDEEAQIIIEKEIEKLIETSAIVIDQFPPSKRMVCMHGSIFHSDYYKQKLKQQLTKKYPDIQFKKAQHSPAKGVYLMMNKKF